METRQGRIEAKAIKDGIGKTGNAYMRAEFTINGLKYSTFDQRIIEAFKTGDYVEMEGEQQGNFWNMKTMKIVEEPVDKDTGQPVRDFGEGTVGYGNQKVPIEHYANGYKHSQEEAKLKPAKEYQLTDGNIRIGALNAALQNLRERVEVKGKEFWALVKVFEEYIRNGSG